MLVGIREWLERYVPQLQESGVPHEDAVAATLLGADIAVAHQTCYGDDNTPVHFAAFEAPYPEAGGCIASVISQATEGVPDAYAVFALGISRRLTRACNETGRRIDPSIVRFAIAVHEVRHRVQLREPHIRKFLREHAYSSRWTDQSALIVATTMEENYRVDEELLRNRGCSDETITLATSDKEFDADMVERLFLHRYLTFKSFDEVAAFIRMPAPVRVP